MKKAPLTPEQIQLIEESILKLRDQIDGDRFKCIITTAMAVAVLNTDYHLDEYSALCAAYSLMCIDDINSAKTQMN